MRRSTRRSMAVSKSVDSSSIDSDSFNKITTRRSSIASTSSLEEPRISVGNFTTKFSMSSFVNRVKELTHDQRIAIERVGFGNVLRIPLHTLRKNLLVELMERWDCEKQAFMLIDRELTISPIDVALILGLRVKGQPIILNENEPISDLEEEYGASNRNRKISVSAIERRLESLGDSADDDFTRTFLLYTFGTLLFHNSNSKIDSRYVSLFKDLDKVSDYAWGVAVLEDLFYWLSRRKEGQAKNMEGCLLLLQVWSYEHIDIGRPNFLDDSLEFPRACHWKSSICTNKRDWFATKFIDLEENQVTWELKITSSESSINIIQELLQEASGQEEADPLPNPAISISSAVHVDAPAIATMPTTSTQCWRLPPKSKHGPAKLPVESKGDMGTCKHDLGDDISENTRLSADISEVTVEFLGFSSSLNGQEVPENHTTDPSNFVQEDYRALNLKYSKLKESMDELWTENTVLRNKLSLNSSLEEEIKKLRKEVADLKEENEHLRLRNNTVDRVDRLICEYFEEASHS